MEINPTTHGLVMMDYVASTWLQNNLNPENLSKTVLRIVHKLRPIRQEFDAIAFRGMSGAIIAPLVARSLKKPLILVRKGENTHSIHMVEGFVKAANYIIIDDFVHTGNTVVTIIAEIKKWQENYNRMAPMCDKPLAPIAQCYGVATYMPSDIDVVSVPHFFCCWENINETVNVSS